VRKMTKLICKMNIALKTMKMIIYIITLELNSIKRHTDTSKIVVRNSFGHSCLVCDRLWFKNDLKMASIVHEDILRKIIMVI